MDDSRVQRAAAVLRELRAAAASTNNAGTAPSLSASSSSRDALDDLRRAARPFPSVPYRIPVHVATSVAGLAARQAGIPGAISDRAPRVYFLGGGPNPPSPSCSPSSSPSGAASGMLTTTAPRIVVPPPHMGGPRPMVAYGTSAERAAAFVRGCSAAAAAAAGAAGGAGGAGSLGERGATMALDGHLSFLEDGRPAPGGKEMKEGKSFAGTGGARGGDEGAEGVGEGGEEEGGVDAAPGESAALRDAVRAAAGSGEGDAEESGFLLPPVRGARGFGVGVGAAAPPPGSPSARPHGPHEHGDDEGRRNMRRSAGSGAGAAGRGEAAGRGDTTSIGSDSGEGQGQGLGSARAAPQLQLHHHSAKEEEEEEEPLPRPARPHAGNSAHSVPRGLALRAHYDGLGAALVDDMDAAAAAAASRQQRVGYLAAAGVPTSIARARARPGRRHQQQQQQHSRTTRELLASLTALRFGLQCADHARRAGNAALARDPAFGLPLPPGGESRYPC